jgi:hypothetical protein
MLTVLLLVNLLHSPCMKDRHWTDIMTVTKKHFSMVPDFRLANLLDLELHRFVTDAEEIIELATKENKIDNQLKKIASAWVHLPLEFGRHRDVEVDIIKTPDEVLVMLEENVAMLQGISRQGRYVYFLSNTALLDILSNGNNPQAERLTFLIDSLVRHRNACLFVLTGGTGETSIVQRYLKSVSEDRISSTINLNSYIDAATLQSIMEQSIDKRSGRIYGPGGGNKKLIYFIDDLNMQFVDTYGTHTPIALMRQHLDYQSWFVRVKLEKKEITDVHYLACMNPTSGSFVVNTRLMCHLPLKTEDIELGMLSATMARHKLMEYQSKQSSTINCTTLKATGAHGINLFADSRATFVRR